MALTKRYCFALDLVDDEKVIAAYEEQHTKVWPEIIRSIRDASISRMDIYRTGNRLFMIMDVTDAFSFERKQQMDEDNETVRRWEALMSTFQQSLPWAKPGEKWVLMKEIFQLPE